MKTLAAVLTLGGVLLAASFAQAAPTMIHNDGMSGPDVVKWLQGLGYKAELSTDKDGDPVVSSASDGLNFKVYFYDCSKTPRCGAIQFSAGFDLKQPLSAAKANEWNRGNRYLKVYLDDENDPHVEYDVNVNAGRTIEGLTDDFSVWTSMLSDFAEFIDW